MRFGINLDLQTDFLTADLGYLTNAGFTFRRGLNLIEDDRLGVELAVRISDHLENVDGTIQVVLIAMRYYIKHLCRSSPLPFTLVTRQ